MQDGRIDNDQYYNYYETFTKDYADQLDYSELKTFKNKFFENNTPLIQALIHNKPKTYDTLLETVKSVNDRNKRGETPLYYICQDGRLEEEDYQNFLKKLVEHP